MQQRGLDIIFGRADTTVTFCRVGEGCKTVARRLKSSNGIARGPQGEIYVSSTYTSQIYVFEAQADDTLVLTDTIPIGACAVASLFSYLTFSAQAEAVWITFPWTRTAAYTSQVSCSVRCIA